MTPAYDAVLFDFDGVLVDSEPIHFNAWVETLRPVGVSVSWEGYKSNCIGISDRELLTYFGSLASPPLEPDTLTECYSAKKRTFGLKIAEMDPLTPETVAMIRSLRGRKLAVVTSSGRLEVEPVLRKAGVYEFMDALVFSEDVSRRKPDPEPYLLAAARLGARNPLVVEDSVAGIASGRAAGFDVLEVTHPDEVPTRVRAALGLSG